ncbi:cell division protein FtsZ [Paludibacter sp. 221]|uniref:cell division protein FtsZ n=1 Tax=Paludibacter sp. 221 TaxID=2302939 RepID=UPI0013D8C7D4|nr:cell division protein FtsZ [Paludibacter sp. 221]NDV47564.1 cell division protein FtsZ [Paludibacter sp. 221]
MSYLDEELPIDLPLVDSSIIKVIGVGGGGSNAVNHMYRQGITDVSFVVCNTDNQALAKSPVPIKIQLGSNTTEGLGAGGNPEVAKRAAEESIESIQSVLKENTKMVFITAGMGGGTGTGASPIVAKAAHDAGILTIGIVTIPFAFEGRKKIQQALEGVVALSEHVDAILVINNEKLREIYPDLELSNAFAKADDVLTNAAQSIAEIITKAGYINTDFADVYSIMKNGNVAIMNTGFASGEKRITKAIDDALNSPLLNTNDVSGAGKILLSLYSSLQNQIRMEEINEVHQFMETVGEDVDVIWGAFFDDTLGDNVKITLIATGFDVSDIPGMPAKVKDKKKETPVKSTIPFTVNDEPVVSEEDIKAEKERIIKQAMGQYYDNIEQEPEPELEPEDDLPTFTLDDLEDEIKRENIENEPAWKRQKK